MDFNKTQKYSIQILNILVLLQISRKKMKRSVVYKNVLVF